MTQYYLNNELYVERGLMKRYQKRKAILEGRDGIKLLAKLSFETLKQGYEKEVARMNSHWQRESTLRTYFERTILEKIGQYTNLKFYPSVWIVNRNIDLFCPSVGKLHPPILKNQKITRQSLMRGLAIEVN